MGAPSSTCWVPGTSASARTGSLPSDTSCGLSTVVPLAWPAAFSVITPTAVCRVAVVTKRAATEPSAGGASGTMMRPKSSVTS